MRLLITSHPGLGHIYPAVAVGAVARRRGHQVAVATARGYQQWVTDAGLQFLEAGPDWNIAMDGEIHPWVMMVKEAPPRFVRDLYQIARDWQPDVILREEMELAGWIVADALGIPVATLGLGVNEPAGEFVRGNADGLAQLRAELGAPSDPTLETIHRYLYLDQYPAGWVPPERRPAGVYHPIGAATLDAETPKRQPGADGAPYIYVTLGTVFGQQPRLIQTILDTLGVLDLKGTVTLGREGQPDAFTAPPGVAVARFIPQEQILPRCAAVICHAGTGTTLGALRYGLPLVLIPMGANQGWTAELAERAGVARQVLGEEPTVRPLQGRWADLETIGVDEVDAALRAVLEDAAYRHRAAETGRELRERWESGVAVTLLEKLAATRQPVLADAQ